MIEGDPKCTSTKVRTTALKILEESPRPLIAHEFEDWICKNDPVLWSDVVNKCYDYIRMILSLTDNKAIAKYKCDIFISGIDRRSAFYGIPGKDYGPSFTQITGSHSGGRPSKRRARKRRLRHLVSLKTVRPRDATPERDEITAWNEPEIETPQTEIPQELNLQEEHSSEKVYSPGYSEEMDDVIMGSEEESTISDDDETFFWSMDDSEIEFQRSETPVHLDSALPDGRFNKTATDGLRSSEYVDSQVAMESWKTLSAQFDFDNPFWTQLLRALTDAKEGTYEGMSMEEILRTIMGRYSLLQQSRIAEETRNIISREVAVNREIMRYAAIL